MENIVVVQNILISFENVNGTPEEKLPGTEELRNLQRGLHVRGNPHYL